MEKIKKTQEWWLIKTGQQIDARKQKYRIRIRSVQEYIGKACDLLLWSLYKIIY